MVGFPDVLEDVLHQFVSLCLECRSECKFVAQQRHIAGP